MATKKQRVMVTVDDKLYQDIQDYRFGNRIKSESEAVAQLIRIGMYQIKLGEPLEEEERESNGGDILREGEEV